MKGVLHRATLPLATQVARRFVAGAHVADAVRVVRRLAAWRVPATIGYWNDGGEAPAGVHAAWIESLEALVRTDLAGYLSVKYPALLPEAGRLEDVVRRAAAAGRRVHFDALGPQHADGTNAAILRMKPLHADLGTTLPSRWRRSLADADLAVAEGLVVRLVKGQWADPGAPELDERAGFLALADRLAGRAREVSVATHDIPLALAAIERLCARGTPVHWELLYGLPLRAARRAARARRVPVRVYVPYGSAWLPYTLDVVARRPGVLGRMLVDYLGG